VKELVEGLRTLLKYGRRVETVAPPVRRRGPTDHVILIDGTMSSLEPGRETNIGQIYRLLQSVNAGAQMSLYYEPGVQWDLWRDIAEVATGRGINDQIQNAYGWLATRYRPGDRIFLFGFSRGAYAVRSLSGIIDRVGLLKAESAAERNVTLAYRYYRLADRTKARGEFRRRFCHETVGIEMIGAFDTVKALGIRLPFLWMWTEPQHDFHNHALSPVVKNGFHALAMNETRAAYAPILWEAPPATGQRVEQVWFPGTHGDVGGHLSGDDRARPLANIPLVWMLERAAETGLALPPDWRALFPTDPAAPSIGTMRGWGKAFLLRARREVGRYPTESLHPSAGPPQGLRQRRTMARVVG
jgi:uncharacterized protein (DUF2235 family)